MIFILGGGGFIGSAFVRRCVTQGWEHRVVTRENYAEFAGRRCNLFVNANGNARKNLATKAPLEDFDASVRSVRKTLIDFPCDTYVYLSSCEVYPDCSSPARTCEDQSIDVARQNPYGLHKYLAEQCVRHAASRWLVARVGGLVGPAFYKNAIFDILAGDPLWLDPASEMQFMATDDAAGIILNLARDRLANEVVNVCGKGTIRLQEVIDFVGAKVMVRPGSPRVVYDVSIDKLSRYVPVPETRRAVLEFVQGQRGLVREAGL